MNEQELDEKILDFLKRFKYGQYAFNDEMIFNIKSLCFQARDKWVLGEIEKIAKEIGCSGWFIYVSDIRKIFKGDE